MATDPPVSSFTSANGAADDANAEFCYAGAENIYWVVWDDHVTGVQSDLYAANFTTAGASPNFIGVEIGTDDSTDPKIAYDFNSNTCFVVSSEIAGVSGNGSIQGQRIDCAAGALTGTQFTISSTGALKVHPDVGGNNWDNATTAFFCVVWSAVWTPGSYHQVQYRIVDFDDTLVTGLVSMTPTSTVHNEPAPSETYCDGDLFGDWWAAAWIEDADNNGLGRVQAQRIVWSGAVLGAGSFDVTTGLACANPSVTSRFNSNLLNISDRPSVVAYEKAFPDPVYGNSEQRSIYATVVTDGVTDVESQASWQLLVVDSRGPVDRQQSQRDLRGHAGQHIRILPRRDLDDRREHASWLVRSPLRRWRRTLRQPDRQQRDVGIDFDGSEPQFHASADWLRLDCAG